MFQPEIASLIDRRTLLHRSALLGAGAMAAGLPLGTPAFAQQAGAAARWPQVARFVESYVSERKVAGMVATMGWGQSSPDVVAAGERMFGSSGGVGPDTLYRIYSMTKPITGLATVMCIEDGLLELDMPLSEVLPGFARMQVQREYDGPITRDNLEPAVRPITIRHLLTHTSGLGYSIVQRGPIRQAYAEGGVVPGRISNLAIAQEVFGGDPAASLSQFADALAELPLVYQPGTRWSYSVGLDLLGRVIEVVSGEEFGSFLERRILGPCGMASTGFHVARADVDRFTGNYFVMGGVPLPIDLPASSVYLTPPPFPFGGAGLVSTPRDYDRFLMMLAGRGAIGGTQVASEAAVALATSNLMPETLASGGGFSTSGMAFGYGAGGLVGQGETAGLFGWFGAAGTVGLVNLSNGLRHNLMTQYMLSTTYPVQADFPRLVAADALAHLPS